MLDVAIFQAIHFTYHLVTAPDEDGDRSRVGALFNHQHLLPRRAESHLADQAGGTELVGRQVLKPGDDSAVCGDGDELTEGFSWYTYMRLEAAIPLLTSISGPPTHLTAGRSFCINRWFASSSKPHWQMTRLAPVSLTLRRASARAPIQPAARHTS